MLHSKLGRNHPSSSPTGRTRLGEGSPQTDLSALDLLLQHIVKETLGAVVRSPFRTERRSLFHLPQGGKQRAVQFLRTDSVHLGFDDKLVACFPDGALRRQLVKSVPDRPGIRAGDAGPWPSPARQ